MQSKYLNTSYLYSSLNTLNIYFKKYTSFFFIFKCRLVSKLLDNLRISLTSGKVIQKFLASLKL